MKKPISLTFVFSVLLLTSYAQSVTLLTAQKSSLTQKVNNLNDSIKYLDELIKKIQLIEVNHSHKISVVVTSRTQVGESDDGGTLFLGYLNKGDSVKLYDLADEWYLARGNYLIGLIPKSSIEQTKSIEKYNKLVTKENKKKKRTNKKRLLRFHLNQRGLILQVHRQVVEAKLYTLAREVVNIISTVKAIKHTLKRKSNENRNPVITPIRCSLEDSDASKSSESGKTRESSKQGHCSTKLLTEPCLTVSRYTALVIQSTFYSHSPVVKQIRIR